MDLGKAYDRAARKADEEINNLYPKSQHSDKDVKREKRRIFVREYRILTDNQ